MASIHPPELPPSPRRGRGARSRYEPSPKRILLAVEDEALRAEILEALAIDRHQVTELEDSWELWDYFQETLRPNPKPHAIITALGLPGPGGLEILASLSKSVTLPPLIGLASAGDTVLFAEAKRLGFSFVFEVPLNPTDLRDTLFSIPGGDFAELPGASQRRLRALERGTRWLADSP
jgi:CheY-like chemotaxis protein